MMMMMVMDGRYPTTKKFERAMAAAHMVCSLDLDADSEPKR